MNTASKEKQGCDVICKNHTARAERDLYRICPSKLSKRELEDLYFALLESNLELKKTIQSQRDKIKILSTKLQRMTVAQRTAAGKEKETSATKMIINEQKESIADLKKANERMADRIRVLNMRLCSAKQFLKRSPTQSTKCTRCATAPSTFKNSSMSALNSKASDPSVKMTSVSCQCFKKDSLPLSTKDAQTATDEPHDDTEKQCNENKCRTQMDELKEKVVDLQEELSKAHAEYSQRITKLESEVATLNRENVRVRGERAASGHALGDLGELLRGTEAKCNDLELELTIEKRKVVELETGLKLANMNNQMANTIDKLTTLHQNKAEENADVPKVSVYSNSTKVDAVNSTEKNNPEQNPEVAIRASVCSTSSKKMDASYTSRPELLTPSKEKPGVEFTNLNSYEYMDHNTSPVEDNQAMFNINKEMMRRISDLQAQLDMLRIKAAGEAVTRAKSSVYSNCDVETKSTTELPSYSDKVKKYDIRDQIELEERELVQSDLRNGQYETSTPKQTDKSKPCNQIQMNQDASNDNSIEQDGNKMNENRHSQVSQISAPRMFADIKEKTKIHDRKEQNKYQIPGPIPSSSHKQTNKKTVKLSKDKKKKLPEDKCVTICGVDKIGSASLATDDNDFGRSISETNIKVDELKTEKAANVKIDDRKPSFDEPMLPVVQPSAGLVDSKEKLNIDINVPSKVTTDSNAISYKEMKEKGANVEIIEAGEIEKLNDIISFVDSENNGAPLKEKPEVQAIQPLADKGNNTHYASTEVSQETEKPARRDSATYTKPDDIKPCNIASERAYTREPKCDRGTSPDNTDREISSLSDLPPEKCEQPVRDILSPGEQRATVTQTETETSHTDYGSLSEGELPNTNKGRRLSEGEKSTIIYDQISRRSSQQMEATLQAISVELERCRKLLLESRPRQTSVAPHEQDRPVGLHRAAAAPRLSQSKPHTCVFTLHVGTLVLADEAVLNSRDKFLILMWKFYDQNVTMARVKAGRVILFDFSSQYDLPYSDEFINYMKYEEMTLEICEMNKQEQPFASCSLPLRDALLHTNRRADMSLAVVSRATHDEIGVLDLWCALRVAPAVRQRLASQRLWEAQDPMKYSEATSFAMQPTSAARNYDDDETEEPRPYHRRSPQPRKSLIDSELTSHMRPSIGSMKNMSKYPSYHNPTNYAGKAVRDSLQELLVREKYLTSTDLNSEHHASMKGTFRDEALLKNKDDDVHSGMNKMMETSKKSVKYTDSPNYMDQPIKLRSPEVESEGQTIDITVLWLALNEECEAMVNPNIRRLYVAYSFLGRRGADLETPISLPKPKHYADKCFFNFKKTFELHDADLPLLGHMSRCRAGRAAADPRNCVVFSVVSEPPEDPLGLSSCEDIGYAYLYLGDILAYSAGGGEYTEVVPVRCAAAVCGVLAVRVGGLHVLRRCLALERHRGSMQIDFD